MTSSSFIHTYLRCCWITFETQADLANSSFDKFCQKYQAFLTDLVQSLKLSETNLVLSLYFLHKYQSLNLINQINLDENISMLAYLVITSLVLSNKTFNDQSYTLKTWFNVAKDQLKFDAISLELLNHYEQHFLSVTNYNLSFNKIGCDYLFWNVLRSRASILSVSAGSIDKLQKLVTSDSSASPFAFAKTCTPPSAPSFSYSKTYTPASVPPYTKAAKTCTPPTAPPSVISTPTKKLNKRRKVASKPYPSPMKTASIPNSPASVQSKYLYSNSPATAQPYLHPNSMLPSLSSCSFNLNPAAGMVATPSLSKSNSPNYCLHYNNTTAPSTTYPPTSKFPGFSSPLDSITTYVDSANKKRRVSSHHSTQFLAPPSAGPVVPSTSSLPVNGWQTGVGRPPQAHYAQPSQQNPQPATNQAQWNASCPVYQAGCNGSTLGYNCYY